MTQTDTNLVSEAAKIYKVLSNSRRISILFFYGMLQKKSMSQQLPLLSPLRSR